jgi:hypothetical protein
MMNKPKMIQGHVQQTVSDFSAAIRAFHTELEMLGRQKIASLLFKKATLTGTYLIEQPNIENLADFIHESKAIHDEEDSPLGILLCIYSGISEDSKQLLKDLENLERVSNGVLVKGRK